MLEVRCYACGHELTEFGALLFSPPSEQYVVKRHLCVECYEKVRATISAIKEWWGHAESL